MLLTNVLLIRQSTRVKQSISKVHNMNPKELIRLIIIDYYLHVVPTISMKLKYRQ